MLYKLQFSARACLLCGKGVDERKIDPDNLRDEAYGKAGNETGSSSDDGARNLVPPLARTALFDCAHSPAAALAAAKQSAEAEANSQPANADVAEDEWE